GLPMFVMYSGSELAESFYSLKNLEKAAELAVIADKYARILEQDFFVLPHNRELKGPPSMDNTLLARHLTPGHIVECLWFYIHFKEFLQKINLKSKGLNLEDVFPLAHKLGSWALEHGWDSEKGGVLRYIDREGGEPRGSLIDDPFEKLIRKTWDTKLWWVHSESLYFCALMIERDKNAQFWQKTYEKIFDYTFSVFPNPDSLTGEWIQIRQRDGTPFNEVVALPVKDPYHIFRNILLLLEL
ncbi:MAG: AGE family epimerase/isomerase, partial [Treponema sp.]|nr:AGE family epimerase/isomerase [Treponema sp.]